MFCLLLFITDVDNVSNDVSQGNERGIEKLLFADEQALVVDTSYKWNIAKVKHK